MELALTERHEERAGLVGRETARTEASGMNGRAGFASKEPNQRPAVTRQRVTPTGVGVSRPRGQSALDANQSRRKAQLTQCRSNGRRGTAGTHRGTVRPRTSVQRERERSNRLGSQEGSRWRCETATAARSWTKSQLPAHTVGSEDAAGTQAPRDQWHPPGNQATCQGATWTGVRREQGRCAALPGTECRPSVGRMGGHSTEWHRKRRSRETAALRGPRRVA